MTNNNNNRAGLDFEKKIAADPTKADKFSFLKESDLYHKYYRYCILEAQEGTAAADAAFPKSDGVTANLAAAPAAEEAAQNVPPPTQVCKLLVFMCMQVPMPMQAPMRMHVPMRMHAASMWNASNVPDPGV